MSADACLMECSFSLCVNFCSLVLKLGISAVGHIACPYLSGTLAFGGQGVPRLGGFPCIAYM
jgi:hypothetical protein